MSLLTLLRNKNTGAALTDEQILALIDPDQMLGKTSLAHYTTAEWSGYEHLIKDEKPTIGTLRIPRGQRCYAPDGVDDYIAVASLTGSETVVSSSGTSTVSIAAGRINFTAGTVWDITLSNGSRYLCNEESGSTAYDIGDNATHGTITNATLSSFHSTSASVTENRNNDFGYRLSGAVYIPKRLNSSLAADGNALTATGKCPQPGHVPQKCVKFDGTDDYASRTGDFRFTSSDLQLTVAAWVKSDAVASGGGVVATWNGSLGYACFFRSDVIRGYKDAEQKSVSVSLSNGVWYHIVWVFSGTSFKGYLNGVQQGTTQTWVNSAVGNGGFDGKFGYYSSIGTTATYQSNVRFWNRALSDSEIAQVYCGVATGDEYAYFPMCEGPGSGNTNTTIYDVTPNGRHLTLANSTPATLWANNTDYTCKAFNYPIKYGWTLNGSGVVVPALLSGASDAAGNAIGQAAGAWASGLQNPNMMPYTNPLGVNIGLETSLDPTADRKTASSSKRRRKSNSGRYTRFGARSTAMSDANSNSYFGD